MNPNHVPWMSLLGIVGLGIGYLAGGMRTDPEGMIPGLYGLATGAFTGMVLRLVFLWRGRSKR